MKTCNHCMEKLSYDHYSANKSTVDNYSNRCKECMSKIRKIKRDEKEKPLVSRIKYDVNREKKECKNCKEMLPMHSFGKSAILADGRENVCSACRKAKRKVNSKSSSIKTSKCCTKCKNILPIISFPKDISRDDGYNSSCKSCNNSDYKKWYKANSEEISTLRREVYANMDEDEKNARRAINRKWYAYNPDRKKSQQARYNHSYNGRYIALKASAKTREIDFNLTRDFMISHWNSNCKYCGEELDTARFDRIDSYLGYTEDNVVPCCSVCNYIKGAHNSNFLKAHLEKMISNMNN